MQETVNMIVDIMSSKTGISDILSDRALLDITSLINSINSLPITTDSSLIIQTVNYLRSNLLTYRGNSGQI